MQISSNLHSNVSRSTRINSSSVHTYIFVCFTLRVILQGFVTQNATETSQTTNQLYTYLTINMIMIMMMYEFRPVLLPFNSVMQSTCTVQQSQLSLIKTWPCSINVHVPVTFHKFYPPIATKYTPYF